MTDLNRYDSETSELRPEQIEHQIEQTRERMSRDIDAIGDKLRPSNLAHEAMDSMSAGARRTGSRLADFVRDNPLPVVAVSLGVTWLMSQRSKSSVSGDRMARYAYTGPERRSAYRDRRGVAARLGPVAERAKETVSDAASTFAERAGELGSGAKSQLIDAKSRLGDFGTGAMNRAKENLLAVAAGAMILGLAVGLLFPETRRENELMGSARDRLTDRARDVASRVTEAATDAAGEVKETLKSELAERGPEMKGIAQDVARRVVDEAKDAAGRIKEQAKNV